MIIAENGGKPTLLGRNWLEKLKVNWNEVFSLNGTLRNEELDCILNKHADLFREGYDGMKGIEAHIRVREGASPIYFKSRPVPYALREAVEAELNKLEENGVIVKIDRSDWASPIVVVPKADGSVRICGDYKVTINQVVDDEQYPLPTAQDLYSTLAGSKVFSKLDLTHAYAQMSVDEASQKYLCINTNKGLYAHTKFPYGVKSAPKIFQTTMDKILQGVEKCVCNQDDILVGGVDAKENLEIVGEVLERLQKYNVRLNLRKCVLLKKQVVYLGLRVDGDGLHPVQEKIDAIKNAPPPKDVSELRSFLGMVQHYSRFLPGLATTLAPLHQLLKKDVQWRWTGVEQRAYEKCKAGLSSDANIECQ